MPKDKGCSSYTNISKPWPVAHLFQVEFQDQNFPTTKDLRL